MAKVQDMIRRQTAEFGLQPWLQDNSLWDRTDSQISWERHHEEDEEIGGTNFYRTIMYEFLNTQERDYAEISQWIDNLGDVQSIVSRGFRNTELEDLPEEAEQFGDSFIDGLMGSDVESVDAGLEKDALEAKDAPLVKEEMNEGPKGPMGRGILLLVAVLAVLAFLMLT